MWEILQKILKDKITPNQLLLLYAFDQSLAISQINPHLELRGLLNEGYIKKVEDKYIITPTGKKIMAKYNNYFVKAKKKTSIGLLGKNYTIAVQNYRTMFPKKKLPSGKPARVNEKTLIDCFRWFFETYDYTWDQVYAATRKYEDQNYMYMKTSQYFIVKTGQNKQKTSELADYCDMIKEGTDDNNNHFKEKVV
jgi:predicted transcriptional regulator